MDGPLHRAPHRLTRAARVLLAAVALLAWTGPLRAQAPADLSGTWNLDREASQFPREIGFNADFVPNPRGDAADTPRGGGRSGRQPAMPALRPQGESYDDSRRRQLLTDEVRTPPSRLTVVDTPASITFTDEAGKSRTVHPDGRRAETLQIDAVSVLVTAHREADKLVVLYAVADLRQIRYTYSRNESPAQLIVDVQFIERGSPGDTVRRVYTTAAPVAAPATTGASAAGSSGAANAPGGTAPGRPAPAPPAAMPRAGSEFTGLTRIGLVVEEPSAQAVACGIKRDAIETAVAKHFTDAGIRVVRNSDEDTYIYVNIMTSTLPTGMCISRYDWSIYSTTEATLSYQQRPLLAQVLLAHKGGLTGSMPSTHGADIIRGMDDGFAQIAGIIRDANK